MSCRRLRAPLTDVLCALLVLALLSSCRGRDQAAGQIEGAARSRAEVERSEARARAAERALSETPSAAPGEKQILFGDLHVHTTYSIDAFLYGLPIFGGEGAHPPADACDFARHCSALDFFSLNDHAEGLTPERWRRSIESLRECNARAGDPEDPDLVAFVGWEWTQTSPSPDQHFGHKNVILPGLREEELPARPITALSDEVLSRARHLGWVRALQGLRPLGKRVAPYVDFLWWIERLAKLPNCPAGVDTRELPADCRENAPTPEILFEKLSQWGERGRSLVIPHGLSWGVHAPPGARLDVQLAAARRAPERQRLLEVYSGHGSGESWREAGLRESDADGEAICPAPSADHLACCWQAGELIRERCAELSAEECEERVVEARRLALAAGRRPHWVVPDAAPEEWLDCDQCRDCFKPAMAHRPRQSAQYGLALTDFEDSDRGRFRFGLIASSDDHHARPGTGYKQLRRRGMSDARGLRSERLESWLAPFVSGRAEDPQRGAASPPGPMGFRNLFDVERTASFLYPGGLVGAHASGRDRESVWSALARREVYGTSGPRILLWFDLLNGPGGRAPMGSAVQLSRTPHFEVRAIGAFEQKPGCPDARHQALTPARLEALCLGECHHPSDTRHRIEAIEIVRIRPQQRRGEPISELVEDPWRRFECDGDRRGCVVRFEDREFAAGGRDVVYYARALQEATPAINGANLRTRFDSAGQPISVEPCSGGWRTAADDDCLAPVRERAWSSPLFVDQGPDRAN